ncbi:MAG: ABC transporter ATP-binding protein [Oscillospiraceae bacterium]|nr:ABC transporter ATP-binding protein [Oscillospiraceae bacterium]
MKLLDIRGLTVRYGALTILDGVSFGVDSGEWLMLTGPNGAGKSTAVAAVTGGVPYEGDVLFEGADVARMRPSARAKNIGVLAQSHHVSYAFTVEEIVRLGRYSHAGPFSRGGSDEDAAAVERALDVTGLRGQRGQSVLTLSGGELQRAFLAQVFAQEPRLLILDEPANHLDLIYQKQTFELLREWLRQPGRAVISVVHDLSTALAFGTRAVLLDKGRVVSQGAVRDVLTRRNLEDVYSMDVYAWMHSMLSAWEDMQ